MAERPAAPTRGDWLRPAFLAPATLIFALGFVGTCCGGGEITARIGLGVRALILAPLVGLTYGLLLVGVDVALWIVRVRRLPTGFGAWLSAAGATIAGALASAVVQSVLKGNIKDETFAAVVLCVIGACALGARLVTGERPAKKTKAAPAK